MGTGEDSENGLRSEPADRPSRGLDDTSPAVALLPAEAPSVRIAARRRTIRLHPGLIGGPVRRDRQGLGPDRMRPPRPVPAQQGDPASHGRPGERIHVISTDTLVEQPLVARWVDTSLDRMRTAAREQEMPVQPHKLTSEVANSFWVNLIGRGCLTPGSEVPLAHRAARDRALQRLHSLDRAEVRRGHPRPRHPQGPESDAGGRHREACRPPHPRPARPQSLVAEFANPCADRGLNSRSKEFLRYRPARAGARGGHIPARAAARPSRPGCRSSPCRPAARPAPPGGSAARTSPAAGRRAGGTPPCGAAPAGSALAA